MKPDEVLKNDQCDAFIEKNKEIRLRRVCNDWQCYKHTGTIVIDQHSEGDTRQEAVTAYRDKYHPYWQPPAPVHDAEWALARLYEHNLLVYRLSNQMNTTEAWKVWSNDKEKETSVASSMVRAVEEWIDKYATPPLPSTLDMLEKLVKRAKWELQRQTVYQRAEERMLDRGENLEILIEQSVTVIEREKGKADNGDK